MPFCPNCNMEYKDGVTVCADCGGPLADEMPTDKSGDHYENWIHLARLTSHEKVELLAEVWDNDGIAFVIQSGAGYFGTTGQMGMSAFQPAGGSYSLYVPEEFIVEADTDAQGVMGDEWLNSRLVDIEEE